MMGKPTLREIFASVFLLEEQELFQDLVKEMLKSRETAFHKLGTLPVQY